MLSPHHLTVWEPYVKGLVTRINHLKTGCGGYMNLTASLLKVLLSELINLKAKGMSNSVIASKMNTTRLAIERASKRFNV